MLESGRPDKPYLLFEGPTVIVAEVSKHAPLSCQHAGFGWEKRRERHVRLTICAIAYEAQQVRVLQAAHHVHLDAELLFVLEIDKDNSMILRTLRQV
jgi:hypothetical protein